MSNKYKFQTLSALVIVAFVLMSMPAAIYAHTPEKVDTVAVEIAAGNVGPLSLPEPGMASIVWTNYNGGGGELTIDLQGVIYKVAPKGSDVARSWAGGAVGGYAPEPGSDFSPYVQVFLAPGSHSYTASVADIGSVTRDIQLANGQVIRLGFASDDAQPVNHNSSTDRDSKTFVTNEFTKLQVFEEDITGQILP